MVRRECGVVCLIASIGVGSSLSYGLSTLLFLPDRACVLICSSLRSGLIEPLASSFMRLVLLSSFMVRVIVSWHGPCCLIIWNGSCCLDSCCVDHLTWLLLPYHPSFLSSFMVVVLYHLTDFVLSISELCSSTSPRCSARPRTSLASTDPNVHTHARNPISRHHISTP
eukprot:493574-Rhodomonas_salina.1